MKKELEIKVDNQVFYAELTDNGFYKVTPYIDLYSEEAIRDAIRKKYDVKCYVAKSVGEKVSFIDENDKEMDFELEKIIQIPTESCYFLKIDF